jgi:hypothetical protein
MISARHQRIHLVAPLNAATSRPALPPPTPSAIITAREWTSFADRKGDRGRDLALYVARMNCGLSIPELAALAGTEPAAASKAIQRMRKRLSGDRKPKATVRKVSAEVGVRVK